MDQPVTAVYDANVLYPAPLRDLLIRVAQAGLVRAKWTEAIHAEWIRNLLQNNPRVAEERIARTKALMDSAVNDCMVRDFESLIDTLSLPDPDDRHVLAAAICAHASVIVTSNLADFPSTTLRNLGIEAQHPDEFVSTLLDISPDVVCACIMQQRASLRNPPQSAQELLKTFEALGLVRTVPKLQNLIDLL